MHLKAILKPLLAIIAFSAVPLYAQAQTEEKELATYMGELQRLTHKLGLSVDAENKPLAKFYLYESLEILGEIQEQLPEYESLPIAVYVDRYALPAYEPMKALLSGERLNNDKPVSAQQLKELMSVVIGSCNQCHKATHFEFIKIQHNSHNPFYQDFTQ